VIKKPSRKSSKKLYGIAEYFLVIIALRFIPVMALMPYEMRMKALNIGYKIFGGIAT
jgi:hypothetical protein